MKSLSELQSFFFDLDGSVYRGEEPIPDVVPLFEQLRSDQKTIGFITNNSTHTARDIKEKLNRMEIMAYEEEIVTATDFMGIYLAEKFGSLTLKVFGSDALREAIESKGHTVLPLSSKQHPDMIVIGRDTGFSYESLKYVVNELTAGVNVIGTNADVYHPGTNGELIPETGSITAAIEHIHGKKIPHIAKPQSSIFHYAMKKCSSNADESIMIGDNFHTDIVGGYVAGMKTAWIHGSGIIQDPDSDVAAQVKPTIKINNIRELLEMYVSAKPL